MNKKEKLLLLTDLSPRLPYGVCVHIRYKEGEPCYGKLTPRDIQWFIDSNIEVIKPYLRPMSSMTTDERYYYRQLQRYSVDYGEVTHYDTYESIDWLNKHHFDYRGLIRNGLALKAPEGMYEKAW